MDLTYRFDGGKIFSTATYAYAFYWTFHLLAALAH
jgi:hypothetical protein